MSVIDKPYWLLFTACLSVLFVQAYQQQCVPVLSIVFQQWLIAQNLSKTHYVLNSLLYQLIYLIALSAVVFILSWALKRGAMAKHSQAVQAAAWVYLFIIGALLVFYPTMLASFSFFFLVLAFSALIGWFKGRFVSKGDGHHG